MKKLVRETRNRRCSFKRIVWLRLLIISFLLTSMASTAMADETIKFGAALSLTGSKATEGRLVKDGYDFYVKHINEKGGIPHQGQAL